MNFEEGYLGRVLRLSNNPNEIFGAIDKESDFTGLLREDFSKRIIFKILKEDQYDIESFLKKIDSNLNFLEFNLIAIYWVMKNCGKDIKKIFKKQKGIIGIHAADSLITRFLFQVSISRLYDSNKLSELRRELSHNF